MNTLEKWWHLAISRSGVYEPPMSRAEFDKWIDKSDDEILRSKLSRVDKKALLKCRRVDRIRLPR